MTWGTVKREREKEGNKQNRFKKDDKYTVPDFLKYEVGIKVKIVRGLKNHLVFVKFFFKEKKKLGLEVEQIPVLLESS